ERGRHDADHWLRCLAIDGWQGGYAKVDIAFLEVGPGPWTADHECQFALVETRVHRAIVGTAWHDALLDQISENVRAGLGTIVVDASVLDVIALIGVLEDVTAIGGQQWPGEVGV